MVILWKDHLAKKKISEHSAAIADFVPIQLLQKVTAVISYHSTYYYPMQFFQYAHD